MSTVELQSISAKRHPSIDPSSLRRDHLALYILSLHASPDLQLHRYSPDLHLTIACTVSFVPFCDVYYVFTRLPVLIVD
jgi:hypothetical protein